MPRIYLVFCLTLLFIKIKGQSNGRLLKEARGAQHQHDWQNAARLYEKLLLRDSSRLDWRYAHAEALFHNYALNEALSRFTLLISADSKKKFPLAYFYRARILQSMENYKEALKNYKKFLNLKKKNIPEYYFEWARNQMLGCDHALLMSSSMKKRTLHSLDTFINSTLSEYAPYETDSILYFSSLKNKVKKFEEDHHFAKIYYADLKSHDKKIKIPDTTLNSEYYHNANYCPVPGTSWVLFSRCTYEEGSYRCRIWKVQKQGQRFIAPEPLPEIINVSGYNTTHPHVAVLINKTYLFFSSNRPGGKGGLDLWMAPLLSAEELRFGTARNLSSLNGPEDEITPFYDSIEKKLFFSTRWLPGFGGFDIFYAPLQSDTFGLPVNSGLPINSPHNDVYYTVNASRTTAYLSSNRKGSRFEGGLPNCCNDIYYLPLENHPAPTPTTTTDSSGIMKQRLKLLVPLTLYFHNDEPDPKTRLTETKKSYDETYYSYLNLREDYKKEYSEGLSGNDKETARLRIEEFFTDSVISGFDDLMKFSVLMENILRNQRDTIYITIKGYCSPLASTDYNINLAKRRISSLKNFFRTFKNGIFLPYLEGTSSNGSRILYQDVDIGELPFSKVSDDLKDKKNSVYSPFAARERKIQILAIKFSDRNSSDGSLSDEP